MPFPIRIRDVMSTPVRTADVETTVAEAAADCFDRDIGSLVVLENGALVGIVTGMDLLEVLGSAVDPGSEPLREVMSTPVVTTSPAAPLQDAVKKMRENDVARLPVLDGDELVGMVSSDDIVRYVPQVFHRQELEPGPREGSLRPSETGETAYEDPDWEVERVGLSDEGLDVGDSITFTKTITERDVRTFAAASGDTNRLHLDAEYAKETRFGRRIVHGTLVSALISAALARLPGLTIYVSQDLSFLAPVDVGERATAICEIVGTFGRSKYELTTDVFGDDDEQRIEGEATVLIDETVDVPTVATHAPS